MLILTAVAATGGALFLAFNIGDRQRKPTIAAILAVIAISSAGFAYRAHNLETQLANAASQGWDGLDITVECRSWIETHIFNQGTPGWVEKQQDDTGTQKPGPAELGHQTCTALRDYINNPGTDNTDARTAVHILSHEAAHVSGIWNESAAECASMLRDAAVAEALGATPQQAQQLADWYRSEQWPRMPARYRQPC